MANRNFPSSRMFSFHLMPVRLGGSITIGASGAVSSFAGPGIQAVTKQGTGVYRIQLQDNYAAFLNLNASVRGAPTGSALDPNTGTVGVLYQISTVGNTNWTTAGIPSGVVPTIGQVFALAAAPASGTGRVQLYAPSAITQVQQAGSPNIAFLNNQPFTSGNGGYITVVCLAPTSSSVTTAVATNPASGEVIQFQIFMNNSSVQ